MNGLLSALRQQHTLLHLLLVRMSNIRWRVCSVIYCYSCSSWMSTLNLQLHLNHWICGSEFESRKKKMDRKLTVELGFIFKQSEYFGSEKWKVKMDYWICNNENLNIHSLNIQPYWISVHKTWTNAPCSYHDNVTLTAYSRHVVLSSIRHLISPTICVSFTISNVNIGECIIW